MGTFRFFLKKNNILVIYALNKEIPGNSGDLLIFKGYLYFLMNLKFSEIALSFTVII